MTRNHKSVCKVVASNTRLENIVFFLLYLFIGISLVIGGICIHALLQ